MTLCPRLWTVYHCRATVVHIALLQASLKRKREEVGEEKAEAIKTHVKVNLDMKEQEEVATTDAKTQVRLHRSG